MADSDDEYDRKRRDKFRGERAEVSYRGAERVSRPRDDWSERDSWSRPRPRDYRSGGVRDRGYSPSMESAPKRMRHDYYGDGYYGHYGPYHQPSHREPVSTQSEGSTPPMMSFKAFLATQDDNISESEAIEKYNDYKLEFQRQQLNEFFVAHKDDEWFRLKYHPEDSVKRKEEQMAALKKRVEVFLDLYNSGKLAGVTVDCCKTNQLLHLMDTVVVKLEGGAEEDLATLDQEYVELEEKSKEQQKVRDEILERKADKQNEQKKEEIEDQSEKSDANEKNEEEENGEIKEEKEESSEDKKEEEKTESAAEAGEVMEIDNDDKKQAEDEKVNADENGENDTKEEKPEKKKEKKRKRSRSYSGSSSSSSSSSSESEDEKEDKTEEIKEKKEEKEDKEEVKEEEKVETIEEDKPEKPKALHKTTSIFLRNLAPTITKQEVEAICARYAGFLRVALAEPQPERRWLRRGWVTFKRDANIKEICWNLNNIRLRDCELGAIVNRDLSRRIRAVNGITAHKQVVRSDINIASRVVLHMDTKAGLWLDGRESKEDEGNELSFGLKSNNPVLHNITDYLIEEASAEEEELLGLEPCADNQESTIVDRDDTLINVLDRIILYLRIVHSIDYYNHCEYPNEDEMPNRCGILHARGPAPTAKTDMTQFIGEPIENKMSNFLPEKKKEENKNEAKLIQLSLKDQDTEIDKFIQANTRELAKDKWLCPLSGKKFKGPDFVRKHIFNKHGEKIEEVKKEVDFFNNYLKDPKRPMLTDAPQTKREEIQAPFNHPNNYGGGGGYGGGYGRPQPYNNYYPPRARGYAPRTRGSPADFRPVIHYRDLDAPREPEEFI
ncbi:serrate RNA effector molecule homolog isoform X2 [Coccinella septempunctata]|uniref:serrate RNA effector molecule homolog isoform X2 n=1 Tax=Coccinella septempunctata TaxID=41139 RepID=UPI001D097F86|nr:serrate RNA effector molecule homolog isoform X2 [Coccinella septempunctata]